MKKIRTYQSSVIKLITVFLLACNNEKSVPENTEIAIAPDTIQHTDTNALAGIDSVPAPPITVSEYLSSIKKKKEMMVEIVEEDDYSEINYTDDVPEVGPITPSPTYAVKEFTANPPKREDDIFQIVEQMPEFPGGSDAMGKFIFSNMNYPSVAKENNIEGKTILNFIVDSTGVLKNIKVLKSSGHKDLDDEAIRIVKLMPKWIPGRQRDKPVPVYFNLPIVFKL